MATITAFIRTTKKKADRVNIRFRLRDGRDVQLFHKSEIEVNPSLWDNGKQEIKAKVVFDAEERNDVARKVASRKEIIREIYGAASIKEGLTSEWLDAEIDKRLFPEKYNLGYSLSMFDDLNEFLSRNKLSDVRERNFRVLERTLRRFEHYNQLAKSLNFKLTYETITPELLSQFENYLQIEYQLIEKYPTLCQSVPESRIPQQRGQNTINALLIKLRTFIIWANNTDKTNNNPFGKFSIKESVYGTPYYITINERNRLYNINLSRHPNLAIQRDIFVFQCLIGCRVGDLYKMTKENVINGAIEYVPRKTKEGRPVTVRVPLNSIAKEILNKYKDIGNRLFPFISEQKYNVAIKRIFLAARLTRPITVINPTTREPEIRPLNEIASSHLARRCFVGNLYKQVKDPNLVGALSGHKEGSRAFARYREIDEQMKTELVKMLE